MRGDVKIERIDWMKFRRRGREILKQIQEKLMPEHARDILAIDVESGGYVLAETPEEALALFRQKFPGKVAWLVRVDGGPVRRYRGHLGLRFR